MSHLNFFSWWEQHTKTPAPYGTRHTSLWEGPPDQVVVACIPEFVLEHERGDVDSYLWSTFDCQFIYLTPQKFENGLEYRMAYDEKTDTVYASRNTWVVPETDPSLD